MFFSNSVTAQFDGPPLILSQERLIKEVQSGDWNVAYHIQTDVLQFIDGQAMLNPGYIATLGYKLEDLGFEVDHHAHFINGAYQRRSDVQYLYLKKDGVQTEILFWVGSAEPNNPYSRDYLVAPQILRSR